ncbi:Beta-galactosidase 4 [Hibiscus syriacus]|uniref:beta-galactosidase n=1 Tax=Hibiscus syriacus TaxID=106335 RepID=A0A6A2X056_HIBSY|nr:Beta-galactosidase 4 [Hibiscus syriacus]
MFFRHKCRGSWPKIVDMMKQEKLYASQGGPIILSQIENGNGNIDSTYGAGAKPYIKWAADMAVSLDTGVPWVMCHQSDALDSIGIGWFLIHNFFFYLGNDRLTPAMDSNKKPKVWTENLSGWFLSFGGAVPYRPVEDLVFVVVRFYQRGGTFQNYYMYHGGKNFGRTTGGPFIATSYDYDTPIDEYGLVRQPKWGHLRDVHKAIKLCEEALIATDPTISSLVQTWRCAYQLHVCFATCFYPNVLADLKVKKGKLLRLKPSSANVFHSEVKQSQLANSSSSNLNRDVPSSITWSKSSLLVNMPSAEEFTPEMVGAKSRNISYLKGKVPS